VDPYSTVGQYPIGGTPPPSTASVIAFNVAVDAYNSAVNQFNSGSLDRPDFNTDIQVFDSAIASFNAAGTSPPLAFPAQLGAHDQQSLVTQPSDPDPGPTVPEPSPVWLVAPSLPFLALHSRWRSQRLEFLHCYVT
jgi:hypothetical protein